MKWVIFSTFLISLDRYKLDVILKANYCIVMFI